MSGVFHGKWPSSGFFSTLCLSCWYRGCQITFPYSSTYQEELDLKNERYERLVKLSRDITIESKRTIFLLHRINSDGDRDKVLREAEDKLDLLCATKFKAIAMELDGLDVYQYLRAISPGLQEFFEALTFHHYLASGLLISYEDAIEKLVFHAAREESIQEGVQNSLDPATDDGADRHLPRTVQLSVPPLEYVMGVADLTGELMRYGIGSISSGEFHVPFELVQFMRQIYEAFQGFDKAGNRELGKKINVMRQSLQKVENACYVVQIRGSEMPKHMLMAAVSTDRSQAVASEEGVPL